MSLNRKKRHFEETQVINTPFRCHGRNYVGLQRAKEPQSYPNTEYKHEGRGRDVRHVVAKRRRVFSNQSDHGEHSRAKVRARQPQKYTDEKYLHHERDKVLHSGRKRFLLGGRDRDLHGGRKTVKWHDIQKDPRGSTGQKNYGEHSHWRVRNIHLQDAYPPITYTKLRQMVENELISASQIIIRLSTEQSGFSQRLKEEMDGGMIQMILDVIGKMCREENPPESFSVVLTDIVKNNFSEKLIRFLYELINENPARKPHAPTHVSNCLDLLKAWVEKIPTTSEDQASMLAVNLQHIVTKLNIGLEKNIMQRLDEINSVLQETAKRYVKVPASGEKRTELEKMHDQSPPNNFRNISVFPTINDINGTEVPFVRTNLVNSAYGSIDHYLDVQFRLLREDFIRPLREGIQSCFAHDGETRLNRQQQLNVKVYEDVTIESSLSKRTGIQYLVHFNCDRFQRVKWETSRRLMFGNLVCLSADKFKACNLMFYYISVKVS